MGILNLWIDLLTRGNRAVEFQFLVSFLVWICAASRLPIKSVHTAAGDLSPPCLRPADHVEADGRDVVQDERISVLEIRQ